jgi:primosomal protein N'
MPETCPQCRSSQIRQYGAGTEKVESEIHLCFQMRVSYVGMLKRLAEKGRTKSSYRILSIIVQIY